MPTYQGLIDKTAAPLDGAALLKERREKIVEIQKLTGRPLVIYFSNFIKGGNVQNNSIDDTDITAFSDLVEDVPGQDLDVLLHTPGGIVESAERIVALLRAKFTSVRFVVPHSAYSAGTVIAFSGDEILMDDRSALGPVDPQIIFRDPATGEPQAVPAQAITLGFERAIAALKDAPPEVLKAYLPMLNKLNVHLFEICKNAEALTRTLSIDFLTRHMFKGAADAAGHAKAIVAFFSDHQTSLSHRRGIGIAKAVELGLNVFDMRREPKLRNAIWQLYCAVEFFIDQAADTSKFYENAFGVSWRRRFQVLQAQLQFGPAPAPPPGRPQPRPRPGGGKK